MEGLVLPLLLLVVVIVVGVFVARKFMIPKKQPAAQPKPAPAAKSGETKISVIGPKMAGKTELIKSVDGKEVSEHVYSVVYDRRRYQVHDKLEENSDGIVFVVDASDIDASVEEWTKVEEKIKGIPIVILGNKNDVAGAKSFAEISGALKIGAVLLNGEEPDTDWPMNMYMTSLKANFGFRPALKWLVQAIDEWKKHK